MKVKKVFNNNILCALDEKGNEVIVTGRGLGFGKHTGESIDESKIEKTYRMVDKTEQRKLRELVEQIPIEDLALTERLIDEIRRTVTQPLNESLLITLADHISFALKRKQQGIAFENPLAGSIMCYYPTEYQLGIRCLEMIRQEYGVELSRDEAAFIALHIVNAELNTHMTQMYEITRLIDGCIAVVEAYYGRQFDRQSLDFSRFIVHLRYFAKRIFQGKALPDTADENDADFRKMIAFSCKKHYRCAQEIAAYLQREWGKDLSDEEMVYLTIHLKRINMSGER